MERTIRTVQSPLPRIVRKKRVAAYARISSGKDAALHSLSSQVSYYNGYIQEQKHWQFAGVYADEAITGTKDARAEFQRLLADCRAGKIDMVITKSISRFARNTVTLLEAVRELKSLGVDVYFEKENLHSISGEGELMLSVLASFAQAESESVSANCKWRIRNDFKEGKVCSITMLGYRRTYNGGLEVEPSEAEIVRMIFADYLSGMGRRAISDKLNTMAIPTRRGIEWQGRSISIILSNEKYTGDLLLQKTYSENPLSKRKMYNIGQLPMYLVQESHEAIIDRETFDLVQQEMRRRAEHFSPASESTSHPLTGKIKCGICGKLYRRKTVRAGTRYEKVVWICATYNSEGKSVCASQQIPEDILIDKCCEVLETDSFDETVFLAAVNTIEIPVPNRLVFVFRNGKKVESAWSNRSRRDSWTEEMRQNAREKDQQRRNA